MSPRLTDDDEYVVVRFTKTEKALLMAIARERGENIAETARAFFVAGFERLHERSGISTAAALAAFRATQR